MGETRDTSTTNSRMNISADSFVYWLQGFFELSGANTLKDWQVDMIKKHLDLVFIKVTDEPEEKHTLINASDLLCEPQPITGSPLRKTPLRPPTSGLESLRRDKYC